MAHLNDPNAWVKTGAGASQAFLFNGIDITLADITIDAHIPALSAASGPLHANGSGFWDFGINCPSCGNGGSSKFTGDILFHVANALVSDLIVANASGNIFAADIFGGNSNTGVVSVPGATTTSGSTSSSSTSGSTSRSSTSGSTSSSSTSGSTSSSSTSGSTSSSTSGDSTGSTSSSSGDSTSSSTSGDTGSSSTGTNTTGVSSSNSTGESSGATTRDIPEPASLLLLGAGLVAVSRVTRRKQD